MPCEPGKLLVDILIPAFIDSRVEDFAEAVQALECLGVNGLQKMKDGVLLD